MVGQHEYPVCRERGAQSEPTSMAVQGHCWDQCVPPCRVFLHLRAVVQRMGFNPLKVWLLNPGPQQSRPFLRTMGLSLRLVSRSRSQQGRCSESV